MLSFPEFFCQCEYNHLSSPHPNPLPPSRITSEAGLEIDSQQEEESVQASDESDLPSTSQDPPSSSSAGTG